MAVLPAGAGSPPLEFLLAEAGAAARQQNESLLRERVLNAILEYPGRSDIFLMLGALTKEEGDRSSNKEVARISYILAFASYRRAFDLEPSRGQVEKKITELHLIFNRKFPGRSLASLLEGKPLEPVLHR
jgi:hypothetical protein